MLGYFDTSGLFSGSSTSFSIVFSLPALSVALAPFLIVFLCLLVCLYPRYVNEGRVRFVIVRNASPDLFPGPDSEEIELEKLAPRTRTAMLELAAVVADDFPRVGSRVRIGPR